MTIAQHPMSSGFSAGSTWQDVIGNVNLAGKRAIVTGGHSGLGRETVRAFAQAGCQVIVPARDVERARAQLHGISQVEVWPMDLAEPASIDSFARRYLNAAWPLHILVNNAGIMALPELARDVRGFELQFATNHLGHFQLVKRLWPALVNAGAARIVSVSSRGHRFSPVDFHDMHFNRRPYDRWAAYGQSKTANVLFAVELDRRGKTHGVRAFAVHPGSIINTGLARHLSNEEVRKSGALDEYGRPIVDPEVGFKTLEQGAATQVWCAVSTARMSILHRLCRMKQQGLRWAGACARHAASCPMPLMPTTHCGFGILVKP
jgi:NAD(P)-dependent dehydrogenase (short-subunit alcohol dehydrogenase family)